MTVSLEQTTVHRPGRVTASFGLTHSSFGPTDSRRSPIRMQHPLWTDPNMHRIQIPRIQIRVRMEAWRKDCCPISAKRSRLARQDHLGPCSPRPKPATAPNCRPKKWPEGSGAYKTGPPRRTTRAGPSSHLTSLLMEARSASEVLHKYCGAKRHPLPHGQSRPSALESSPAAGKGGAGAGPLRNR